MNAGEDLEGIQELLERCADPDARDELGVTALMAASSHGHPAAARLLLSWGANVDAQNVARQRPLHATGSTPRTPPTPPPPAHPPPLPLA